MEIRVNKWEKYLTTGELAVNDQRFVGRLFYFACSDQNFKLGYNISIKKYFSFGTMSKRKTDLGTKSSLTCWFRKSLNVCPC